MASKVKIARTFVRSLFNSISIVWLVTLSLAAITYKYLPFNDPNASDFQNIATSPSGRHWLGTDEIGRDLLARTVAAAQVSLQVGFIVVSMAALIGGTLGLCAGYFRGKLDSIIMTSNDVLLAFPGLILALALVSVLGTSVRNVILALSIVLTPAFTRVARASTMSFTARPFVTAARSMGANNAQIILGELVINVGLSILSYGLAAISIAILAEGALSFLGLSVPPPTATWGGMIVSGKEVLRDAPHVVLVPALTMFLTVLSFNSIGEKFRKIVDKRVRQI
jgi:peptide/nickel transport system permease protein